MGTDTKKLFIVPIMLIFATTACIISDAKKAAQTISKTAGILQEVSDSGTWKYTVDGINALDKTAGGYAASITMNEGTSSDNGQELTTTTNTMAWEISADGNKNASIHVTQNDQVRDYVTIHKAGGGSETYLVNDGTYACVMYSDAQNTYSTMPDQNGGSFFATSADQAFATYSLLAAGVQAISVAQQDGEDTINGISTTRYRLVSKLQEALDALAEFPSADLQASLGDVPKFYINGSINIDKSTGALIRFDSQYANLDEKKGNQFKFEVKELGNQPAVPMPEPSQITTPCTGGTVTGGQ